MSQKQVSFIYLFLIFSVTLHNNISSFLKKKKLFFVHNSLPSSLGGLQLTAHHPTTFKSNQPAAIPACRAQLWFDARLF